MHGLSIKPNYKPTYILQILIIYKYEFGDDGWRFWILQPCLGLGNRGRELAIESQRSGSKCLQGEGDIQFARNTSHTGNIFCHVRHSRLINFETCLGCNGYVSVENVIGVSEMFARVTIRSSIKKKFHSIGRFVFGDILIEIYFTLKVTLNVSKDKKYQCNLI